VAGERTIEGIRHLARLEEIITDLVYEGKSITALIDLVWSGLVWSGLVWSGLVWEGYFL